MLAVREGLGDGGDVAGRHDDGHEGLEVVRVVAVKGVVLEQLGEFGALGKVEGEVGVDDPGADDVEDAVEVGRAEVDKDVIPTEKVTVKPRSGLAPTPPRPTGCSSDGPSSTTKPEFNIGASTKWKVAGGAAGFFATVGSLEYQYQVDTGGVAPKTAETISSVANVADVFLVTGVPQPGSMGGHTPGDMLLAYLAEEFYIRYAAFRKGRFFVDPPTACELEYFRFMGVEPPHEF